MKHLQKLSIRELQEKECEMLANTFLFPWTTLEESVCKWKRYFSEQQNGMRKVFICEKDSSVVGYGTLLFQSEYPLFNHSNIPEINDIWVDGRHRGHGYGKALVCHIEDIARTEGFTTIGIGVGLYQDYGHAQALYCKLGYIPDGNGITYKYQPITPGEKYPVNDDLILWFTKKITAVGISRSQRSDKQS